MKYIPEKILKKSRFSVLYDNSGNSAKQFVVERISRYIEENRQYCDNKNYGYLCNLFAALAFEEFFEQQCSRAEAIEKVEKWRFGVSIIFAMLGVIGVGLGLYSIANQIYASHYVLAVIWALTGYSGVVGGFFVHSSLCIQAVIYKRIMSGGEKNFELADHTMEGFYKAIKVPFFLMYIVLMTADICVSAAVIIGALPVPKWMALLNSVVFLLVGWLFRKINPRKFQDLPGIIMPSLGLAMVGLIGIAALL